MTDSSDKSNEEKYPLHHKYKEHEKEMELLKDFIEGIIESQHGPTWLSMVRNTFERLSDTCKAELIMAHFGINWYEFQQEKEAMVQELRDKANKESPYG